MAHARDESSFHDGLFGCVHLAAAILLLVSVGAFSSNIYWYHFEQDSNMDSFFNAKGWQHTINHGDKTVFTSWSDGNLPELQNAFQLSNYFGIAAAALSGLVVITILVLILLQKRLSHLIERILRAVLIGAGVFSFLMIALSFGLFFRVTAAFKSDSGPAAQLIAYSCTESTNVCSSFMGTSSNTIWRPDTGFWLVLVALAFTLVSFHQCCKNPRNFEYARLE